MNRPRIYLDEDVYFAVALGLRRRGFDALSTVEAGRRGRSDEDQLRFASAQERALITFNRGDFARIHGEWLAAGTRHCGIIVSRQAGVGPVVRAVARLLGSGEAADFVGRFVWLAPR